MRNFVIVFMLVVLTSATCCYAETVPFDSDRWEIKAQESRIEDYMGRKALFLKGGEAIVKDSVFKDGVIEYDFAFGPERGFSGVFWRCQNSGNYEKFYMRSHRSGNPDACQYTPIFNQMSSWQLYPEYGTAVRYSYDKWMHLKLVVSGKQAEVYIEDMDKPVLFIDDLKGEEKPGKVGLWVLGVPEGMPITLEPTYFSNFSFTEMNNPPLKGDAKKQEPAPDGMIMSWSVSNTFDEKSLEGKFQLTEKEKKGLSWKTLESDRTGMGNLSKVQGIEKGKDTVFAKVTIGSEKNQTKQLSFGFSDKVRVYLNDQLIYFGSDPYRSRDYRFLGTVGFYDQLYLPLKKGNNELCMAVSESMLRDGWAVQGRLSDTKGISIKK